MPKQAKNNMMVPVPYRGQARAKTKIKKIKKQLKDEKKEMTILGKMLRTIGGGLGTAAGSYLGNPVVGGAVGTNLGAAVSRWFGQGDYQVQTNTILGVGSIPMMHNEGQSIIVRHKEFVGEIVGSQSFTVQRTIALNPGLASSFPWLSKVAAAYQEYRIRGMVFHYIPSSGSSVGSTNTALGTIMFQTTYRASDSAPANKLEMLNEYCSNEVVPSDTLAHPIECDPAENPFNIQYIRSTAVPAGDTPLSYDLGVTHIATSGMQVDGKTIGDVWVTYEVEFKKPQVNNNTLQPYTGVMHTTSTSGSGVFNGVDWTNQGTLAQSMFIGSYDNKLFASNLTIGATYVLYVMLIGGGGVWSGPGAPTYSGATAFTPSGSISPYLFTTTTAASAATARVFFTATSSTCIVTFGAFTVTSLTDVNVTLSRISV